MSAVAVDASLCQEPKQSRPVQRSARRSPAAVLDGGRARRGERCEGGDARRPASALSWVGEAEWEIELQNIPASRRQGWRGTVLGAVSSLRVTNKAGIVCPYRVGLPRTEDSVMRVTSSAGQPARTRKETGARKNVVVPENFDVAMQMGCCSKSWEHLCSFEWVALADARKNSHRLWRLMRAVLRSSTF